ncbi:hypothetical protein K491DRAFT_588114 [Lophiostoma macrostomum CBS 122681]|uniref:Amino acid permease-domain-containing protein n=1 Tax=Lophiostoma macrostomum CBS 122681 TaxID=1314788 RepID=A0A6A6TLT9_9PLEO|nr:hypothetical protein K491DRAFT_588114 [Lophiostoma macrostomum CBS 122681]
MTTPHEEEEPLLSPSSSTPRASTASSKTIYGSDEERETATSGGNVSRSIEDDVLPETSVLGRNISWSSAYILVISRVIGSGIFATPGAIFKSVGSVGLSLTLWVAGAVIAACGLAVSLEYGCMLPRSGGEKVYLEFTYRKPRFLASTLVAVQAVVLGFTASNCIVFAEYTLFAFDVEATDLARKTLAVGLLTAITIVHGCFLKTGIAIQNFLGWIKVGLVIFMILAGLFVVLFQRQDSTDTRRDRFASQEGLWEGSDWSWGVIATSLFKVFYSYAGLTNVNNSVSISSLLTACFLYVLVNIAYFMVVPLDEIRDSGELIAALFFERSFGPHFGKKILPLAVALSGAGNVMVVTFALARLNQEIARQGFLPWSNLLASSKPFNAPMGGLIVHYIPSLLVIALPPSKNVYSFILEVEGYPGQIFALATTIGLLWLRYKRRDLKRPFKAWIGAAVFRVALSLALLAAPFFPPKDGHGTTGGLWYATYAVVGVSIIAFGFVYWYVWTRLLPKWKGYRLEEETNGSPPHPTYTDRPETYNRPVETHSATVRDVSGREKEYTLDGNGFQFYRHTSVEKDFKDDEQIKAQYYPETEQLLKDATGASRIFIFDHTLRRQPVDATAVKAGDSRAALRGPVQRVHIDQSYAAALSRVPHHLPEEADKLLQGRVEIINVWRPIKTVQRDPLAVAEADSVDDKDLVVTELIYPNRRGETLAVKYDPGHRWFYKNQLTPDEVILIKCFDSKKDGRARRVPHTAFEIPGTQDKEGRESIEVRALVFHEHESLE